MRTSNIERPTSNIEVKKGKILSICTFFLFGSMAGCQSNAGNLRVVSFDHTPAAVQSAFVAYFTPAASIQKVEREQVGDQDYYTFTFVDKDHHGRVVELNEGGDQVQEK